MKGYHFSQIKKAEKKKGAYLSPRIVFLFHLEGLSLLFFHV